MNRVSGRGLGEVMVQQTGTNRAARGGWFARLARYRDLIGLVILLAISAACTVAWVVKTSKPPVQLPIRQPVMKATTFHGR